SNYDVLANQALLLGAGRGWLTEYADFTFPTTAARRATPPLADVYTALCDGQTPSGTHLAPPPSATGCASIPPPFDGGFGDGATARPTARSRTGPSPTTAPPGAAPPSAATPPPDRSVPPPTISPSASRGSRRTRPSSPASAPTSRPRASARPISRSSRRPRSC